MEAGTDLQRQRVGVGILGEGLGIRYVYFF